MKRLDPVAVKLYISTDAWFRRTASFILRDGRAVLSSERGILWQIDGYAALQRVSLVAERRMLVEYSLIPLNGIKLACINPSTLWCAAYWVVLVVPRSLDITIALFALVSASR